MEQDRIQVIGLVYQNPAPSQTQMIHMTTWGWVGVLHVRFIYTTIDRSRQNNYKVTTNSRQNYFILLQTNNFKSQTELFLYVFCLDLSD